MIGASVPQPGRLPGAELGWTLEAACRERIEQRAAVHVIILDPEGAMIVTTGNEVAGRAVLQYLGIVRGVVVRSTSVVSGITGGLKSLFGGNISEYETVCDEARQHAFERMVAHARGRSTWPNRSVRRHVIRYWFYIESETGTTTSHVTLRGPR